MAKVRIIYIDPKLLKQYKSANSEVLLKQRPCLLVVKLRYRGKYQDFAIPIRSNLKPTYSAQGYYFELPPRFTTELNKVHALDFRKIVPVERRYTRPFQISDQGDRLSTLIPIQENLKQIIKECQNYLKEYEETNGNVLFSTDIDLLLSILEKQDN